MLRNGTLAGSTMQGLTPSARPPPPPQASMVAIWPAVAEDFIAFDVDVSCYET